MKKRFLSALAAAILCVQSSFGQTVITSLPYTISSSGTFVLGSSLAWPSATGNAITIAASDVTLDLGGHYLSHAGTANGNVAVYVHNAENVTIQNGIIVAFTYGVYYAGTTNLNSGNIVQNLRLTNVLNGIFLVGATLSKVTNNQIINFGAVGGTGVYLAGGGDIANGNIISGFSAGIASFGNSYLFENTLSNCGTGLNMFSATDKYRCNTTFNCSTAFSGGIAVNAENN
ncbi:MAG TPA: hypothetical protein VFO40_00020 [Chthoniobacterales bacterium]|nr:hypothetical protein [Chthoniobacterales bacterium]